MRKVHTKGGKHPMGAQFIVGNRYIPTHVHATLVYFDIAHQPI